MSHPSKIILHFVVKVSMNREECSGTEDTVLSTGTVTQTVKRTFCVSSFV
jgi:hypothetical protein